MYTQPVVGTMVDRLTIVLAVSGEPGRDPHSVGPVEPLMLTVIRFNPSRAVVALDLGSPWARKRSSHVLSRVRAEVLAGNSLANRATELSPFQIQGGLSGGGRTATNLGTFSPDPALSRVNTPAAENPC